MLDFRGFLSFPFHPILLLSKPPSATPSLPLPSCNLAVSGCSGLQIVVAGGIIFPPEWEI
ncbi:hypothetical protein RHMOL_Rhmol13G0204100 [Rhododendron molle]|uniref:Uncharacterized protein n=1 Tax=Rhododendron molle TaxID=49168 RepID=A0ACC0LA91_RHOML|nr:hypothetical protein RHMOL_Rhmol13G0204100 [Rhododendron molle]